MNSYQQFLFHSLYLYFFSFFQKKKYGIDNRLFILLVKKELFLLPDKLFMYNTKI